MEQKTLFSAFQFGNIGLKNRIVMAPMTRSRAIGNIPNELIATYYEQRAGAGLIITEGTSPSPNGLGYSRIPGIFSSEQIEGWKKVTYAVHSKGGRIFVQLMHTGRISHQRNLPNGSTIIAPSAVKPAGQMWTDTDGMQDFPTPKEMSLAELKSTKEEFVNAAKNAISAGFDGVELHGANGYLLEQFISPVSNQRTDSYGGSIENRCRFAIEVAKEVANAIGKNKVGIRFSPYGVASDMPHYPEINETYTYLAKEINEIGLVYIHLVDHSAMGAPEVPASIKKTFRDLFKGILILSGGYDLNRAEQDIEKKSADLITFGRPFINNPDLVYRLQNGKSLSNSLDMETFYTPDEKGYTDYPFLK